MRLAPLEQALAKPKPKNNWLASLRPATKAVRAQAPMSGIASARLSLDYSCLLGWISISVPRLSRGQFNFSGDVKGSGECRG